MDKGIQMARQGSWGTADSQGRAVGGGSAILRLEVSACSGDPEAMGWSRGREAAAEERWSERSRADHVQPWRDAGFYSGRKRSHFCSDSFIEHNLHTIKFTHRKHIQQ